MKKIERLIKEISADICYCYNCQPYEGGEPFWILGERTDLEELFDDYDVPEDKRNEIADAMKCPWCGTHFQRGIEVGIKTKSRRELEKKLTVWRNRYANDFEDFAAFLEKFPYLGIKHTIGKKIITNLSTFPKKDIKDDKWFRARTIVGSKRLSCADFKAPDQEVVKIPEGRFNHYGQSHWYLASTEYGAAYEAASYNDDILWVQCVNIRYAVDILDLRVSDYETDLGLPVLATGIIFSSIIRRDVIHDRNWKPEYFVPRFIADCAKLHSFQGILFDNDKFHGANLVLFHPDRVDYEFIENPRFLEIPRVGTDQTKNEEADPNADPIF
ncbi:MAG: RES family NAD+ phosphorylase [candidate division Zixibacteria bacterium]|nr:RES family NAD+ phosphorylase [candidate division Zixibacteria bacterium]